MSNEFTPQHFNLNTDQVVVIGTVALPSGPVRVSASTAPKIAIAQNASGYSSIKNIGKEDSMITITALFNDEFVDDATIVYKGLHIPADMYSLLALLELMPFVPIYSSELAKLVSGSDYASDYFFGALQSLAIKQYSDFNRTYEVTMSFLITDISPYIGNIVGYKENESVVSSMYLSNHIKQLVEKKKKEIKDSPQNSNNIIFGIDSFTVINNFENYISRIKIMLSEISTSNENEFAKKAAQLSDQINYTEENMKNTIIQTFNEINSTIKHVAEDSTMSIQYSSVTKDSEELYRIYLDNIVNISVGYDNYMNPTYMQDSAIPIHSFMGRSPVSAQVSFVCQSANDVKLFKTLYYMIQKIHRDIDFLGYSMPATINGEAFSLVGMQNATITKIDISTLDEIPNSFMVTIMFVDGSKGIMSESAASSFIDDTSKIAKNVVRSATKAIAEAIGYPQEELVNYFINNSFDSIVNKIGDTEELYRELIIDVARLIDSISQAVVNTSVAGAMLKLDYTKGSKDSSFREKYVAPYFGGNVEYKESNITKNKSISGSKELIKNFVVFNSVINNKTVENMYSEILSDFTNAVYSNDLTDYMLKLIGKIGIKKENKLDNAQEVNDSPINLYTPICEFKESETPGYLEPNVTEKNMSDYFGEEKIIANFFGSSVDLRRQFLQMYSCAAYGNKHDTLNFTFVRQNSFSPLPTKDIMENRRNLIEEFSGRVRLDNINAENSSQIESFLDKLEKIYESFGQSEDEAIKKNPSPYIYTADPSLFNFAEGYFEFTSSLSELMLITTNGNEYINNDIKVRTAYERIINGFRIPDSSGSVVYSFVGTSQYLTQPEITDIIVSELNSEALNASRDIPGMLCTYLNSNQKMTEEYINKTILTSKDVAESYFMFEYNLSKAISTLDPVMLNTYGSVIRNAVLSESASMYTLVNPHDFYVEGHDYRVVDSLLSKAGQIATETGAIFSGKSFLEGAVSLSGEVMRSTSDGLIDAYINDIQQQLNLMNHYINNNYKVSGPQVLTYRDYYSEVIMKGTTGYVNGNNVIALHDELMASGIIKEVKKKNASGEEIIEYEIDTDILSDESKAAKFIALMDKYIIEGRIIDNALVSESYSKEQNEKEIFSITEGIKKSSLTIDNMCPQMFVVFMWTKKRIFIPVQFMFEFRGVISVEIQKSREDPSDKAIVVLSNSKGILTNSTLNDYQYLSENSEGMASKIDKLLVKEGVAMQLFTFQKGVKSKIFEGIISGAQYQGNTVTIIADGYGSALQKPVYTKEEKLGGGCTNPREMVIDAITRTNSVRIGCPENGFYEMIKRMAESFNKKDYLWLYSDKFLFPTLRYNDMGINVYSPDKYWPLLNKSRIKGISYLEQYQADYKAKAGYSAWDVICDAANRVPGFIAAVTDFDAGNGRVFFGKPEWTYVFTSKLDPQFWKRASEMIAKDFNSKKKSLENVIDNEIIDYYSNMYKEIKSIVYEDLESIEITEEKIGGYSFNIPSDIPTAEESEGYVIDNIITGTSLTANLLYDGDTLYTDDIIGSRTGYRFIGYDCAEIDGEESEKARRQRDAAYALIKSFGEKLLVIPTQNKSYERYMSYAYVYYTGTIPSLRNKWISLSSLMIASGYINEFLHEFQQDSEQFKKNIKYHNYFNKIIDSGIIEDLIEGAKDSFQKISSQFLTLFKERIKYIMSQMSLMANSGVADDNFNSQLIFTTETMMQFYNGADSIFRFMTSNYGKDQAVTNYVNRIITAGSIQQTNLYNVIMAPLDSIQSVVLTLSDSMSNALALSNQYFNITKASEDPQKRVFSVIREPEEYEKYINVPGTKIFRNNWLAVSRVNLIDNGIMTDSSNVFNQIVLTGRRDDADVWPVFKQVWRFIKSIFGFNDGDVSGDEQRHTIIADVNIPEWERKTLMATDEWADTMQTRVIVGTSILINSLKNMYQGEITIIGNPTIKPHDMLYINDEQNEITGTAIVRTVRHHFGQGIGFITRIEVDPIIEARDLSVSKNSMWLSRIAKVGVAVGLITLGAVTGGSALIPALSAYSAGIAASKGVNSIMSSLFFEHANYSAVTGKNSLVSDTSQIGAYISTTEAFNLLKIKPLSKSLRPLVAGINGYSPEIISSFDYMMQKSKKSWTDFILGLKMFGYSYQYLVNYVNTSFAEAYADILQYMETLND